MWYLGVPIVDWGWEGKICDLLYRICISRISHICMYKKTLHTYNKRHLTSIVKKYGTFSNIFFVACCEVTFICILHLLHLSLRIIFYHKKIWKPPHILAFNEVTVEGRFSDGSTSTLNHRESKIREKSLIWWCPKIKGYWLSNISE